MFDHKLFPNENVRFVFKDFGNKPTAYKKRIGEFAELQQQIRDLAGLISSSSSPTPPPPSSSSSSSTPSVSHQTSRGTETNNDNDNTGRERIGAKDWQTFT